MFLYVSALCLNYAAVHIVMNTIKATVDVVINHNRFRIGRACNFASFKCYSSSQSAKDSPPNTGPHTACVVKEGYKMVYTFNFIRVAGLVGKSKLYQTWLTGLAVPTSLALTYSDTISYETALPIAGVGLAALVATYSIGVLCHHLVGFIYISTDYKSIKISHLDFWGKRVDDICPTEDIVPISELPDKPTSIYVNIKHYSNNGSKKLSLKYGKIEDINLFRKIFGYAPIY